MINEVLCGRVSEPPADPERAGALTALVVRQLAHRLFLDAADVRIVEFVRQVHQQTGMDPHLLDAVVRGLLGEPLPTVNNPLTPLLVLGRALVVALELDERAVAELVARADQQLPDRLPSSAAPSGPQPSTPSIPVSQPTPPSPVGVVRAAPPHVAPPTPTAPPPPRAKTPYLVGGALAAIGVLAVVGTLVFHLGASPNQQDPPPTATSAPPESDPSQVTHAFAEAINNKRFDRAGELLCSEPSSMTRHIAKGQLRVTEFAVDSVEMHNSTTAYVMARATLDSQSEPLVWRGTLRTVGGDWCVLDIHPEDNSPPAQSETRDVAFEKMRNFITLVSQSDSVKPMSYTCGTRQSIVTQSMIDAAIKSRAQLAVAPDHGPESATRYTGAVTGTSQFGKVTGRLTASRSDDGTYCISYFEITYE